VSVQRRDLIESHLPLVRHIVIQVALRFPRHVDRRELARAGALGLVEAAQRFDPERGVPFQRFAASRIRGAILDAVRAADWAPRSVRTSARRLDLVEQRLAVEQGRVPSAGELADALRVSPAELADLRAKVSRSVVLALEYLTATEDDLNLGDVLADRTVVEPEEALESRELVGYLHDAVRLLPERHRAVVVGYFLDGRTSRQLAVDLGVTESRVSQLRTEALSMLREGIGAQYDSALAETGRSRAARRRASYAAAISDASTWRHRLDRPALDPVAADPVPEVVAVAGQARTVAVDLPVPSVAAR
jgi:RNA polymerase sigma factor for flagellar operon FliA